jgi:hypothetical protein
VGVELLVAELDEGVFERAVFGGELHVMSPGRGIRWP